MTKVRKVKRNKKFKYNRNRKRMKKQLAKTPSIQCNPVNREWQKNLTARQNMTSMGLAYDPNVSIKISNSIKPLVPDAKEPQKEQIVPKKIHVAQALEEDAKAPREKRFRLPNPQVEWVTYLIDKYDEDYKAMARDDKNYYQETWKQLRAKVNQFKRIPEQYNAYLEAKKVKNVEENKMIN